MSLVNMSNAIQQFVNRLFRREKKVRHRIGFIRKFQAIARSRRGMDIPDRIAKEKVTREDKRYRGGEETCSIEGPCKGYLLRNP